MDQGETEMKAKKNINLGLSAFTTKAKSWPENGEPVTITLDGSEGRERGKKEIVALTIRLPRADWERLHQLAVSEGLSLQTIAVRGLNHMFAEKGLPGIGINVTL